MFGHFANAYTSGIDWFEHCRKYGEEGNIAKGTSSAYYAKKGSNGIAVILPKRVHIMRRKGGTRVQTYDQKWQMTGI